MARGTGYIPENRPISTGLAEGAQVTSVRSFWTSRPGWLICIQTRPPPACPALAEGAQVRAGHEDDISRLGHGASVHHDMTGDEQASSSRGPPPVQRAQAIPGKLPPYGQLLLHRGLGDAVR